MLREKSNRYKAFTFPRQYEGWRTFTMFYRHDVIHATKRKYFEQVKCYLTSLFQHTINVEALLEKTISENMK